MSTTGHNKTISGSLNRDVSIRALNAAQSHRHLTTLLAQRAQKNGILVALGVCCVWKTSWK